MRILVLGADGMAGHALAAGLAHRHEVHCTCNAASVTVLSEWAPGAHWHSRIEASDFAGWVDLLHRLRPQVVVNALGLIKQRPEASDAEALMRVNGRFPQVLAGLADAVGAKVVHLGTDCVFSGRRGQYAPSDVPDPVDDYGRSKLAGELTRAPHLTLRTSIIGLELRGKYGLIEWFLTEAALRGTVRGYAHAIFSGLTNHALADVIGEILARRPDLSGVHHVAAAPLSKLDLLLAVRDALGVVCDVVPDATFHCDRSLDGSEFDRALGAVIPSWSHMLEGLAARARRYGRVKPQS